MLDERDYLFRFFGYGDPAAPIWFIGIEEGGQQGASPKPECHSAVEVDGQTYYFDTGFPDGNQSPVWPVARNLAAAAGMEGRYFLSNMAPLARPEESEALEGIDEPSYHTQVRTTRIPALLQLARHFGAKALVFHGQGAWRRYDVPKAAGLTLPERATPKARVLAFPQQGVILTGSFARGSAFTRADRATTAGYLRAWCGGAG